MTPTPEDFQKHRLSMGTALLGNGFYEYDLRNATSAPYWFDEYSVDSSGNAIEDRAKKGYLGQPLSDATELTNPGTLTAVSFRTLLLGILRAPYLLRKLLAR
jgi:hypothetical protein